MLTICHDVVNEILSYCDSQTTASLLSTHPYFYALSQYNHVIQLRQQLAKNLKKTKVDTKKYYNSTILNLKVDDQITDNIYNYRVVYVKKKIALLAITDLYGHCIDNELVPIQICNIKQFNYKKKVDNLYWATCHYDLEHDIPLIIKLRYGVIKHRFGPSIKSVNSYYLNYKTCEQSPLDPPDEYMNEPELNMLVTVNYKWQIYEYVIELLRDDYMMLKLINHINHIDMILHVNKIDDEWVIQKKKYHIINFGGFLYNN